MLFDTHSHLNFKAFSNDFEDIISQCLQKEIWTVMVGTQISTSAKAVSIADKYSQGIYAAIGLHPVHLMESMVTEEEDTFRTRAEDFDLEEYKKLAKASSKVVAVGEVGLDYYWLKNLPPTEREKQKEKQEAVFKAQFEMAQELGLPLIIHCREAFGRLLELLKKWMNNSKIPNMGVIHSYTAGHKLVNEFVDLGFKLGFNGIITYSPSYNRAIMAAGVENIVIETDCPYLTPTPLAKTDRNTPLNVKYVAEKIAGVLDIDYQEVAELTSANARSLFKIN